MTRLPLALLLLTAVFSSCQWCRPDCTPCITYAPQQRHIAALPSPFEALSAEEIRKPWGKEMFIAAAFAQDLDLYRAITTYKRALVLAPIDKTARRLQISYSIALSYYLGRKYCDAIETFEQTELLNVTENFPAYDSLLLILFDAYHNTDQAEKADKILELIRKRSPEVAEDLSLGITVRDGKVGCLKQLNDDHRSKEAVDEMVGCYCCQSLSVRKAQVFNALLPGTGYAYVGQHRSAITSALLNGLFIWATVRFFDEGYTAAGIITAGFEAGWYFGGINGAGLEAQQYNQCLYQELGKELMLDQRLFPTLMLSYAF